MSDRSEEIFANLERAGQSLDAAREMFAVEYFDFAASRAYYAAFYASTAALLTEDMDLSKHSAVISLIHQKYVKTGRLEKEQGKALTWLFELRNLADYGGIAHVTEREAERSIQVAQDFLDAIKAMLGV